jgi:hypothetical protein
VLIDLHYLPGLAFFANVLAYETVWLEACEHFQKQTYRNRCRILTAQGVDGLIIPVVGGRSAQKVPVRDARIDPHVNQGQAHWRAIRTAYGKAPFFPDYADALQPLFVQKPVFLFDFNYQLLTTCLRLLGTSVNLQLTHQYDPVPNSGVLDRRGAILPRFESGPAEGYRLIPYRQNFGEQFFSNLSVIDLLFCQGPEALSLLRRSVVAGPVPKFDTACRSSHSILKRIEQRASPRRYQTNKTSLR